MKSVCLSGCILMIWLAASSLRAATVLTTLLSFNGTNGSIPLAALVQGPDGALYGTTTLGGAAYDGSGFSGHGTVFRLTLGGVLSTLVSFNVTNGKTPVGALLWDGDRTFYGTTAEGGANSMGTVFKMTTNGTITTLASFDGTNGSH